jgi:hypothetical protein
MMETAAIYKQRSVECERRATEAKDRSEKEVWRSRAADLRTLAVEVSQSGQLARLWNARAGQASPHPSS